MKIRTAFSALILLLAAPLAQAGQVLLSCDLAGYQDVEDIQVKSTAQGLKIDVFLVGEKFSYYSLPMAGSKMQSKVDLSGFNVFNDLDHPRLAKRDGQWFFMDDADTAHPISCRTLQ